jgi:hypothetical protein
MDEPVVSFSVKPSPELSPPNTLKCPTEAIVGRKKQDDCHDSTIGRGSFTFIELSGSGRFGEDTNLGHCGFAAGGTPRRTIRQRSPKKNR